MQLQALHSLYGSCLRISVVLPPPISIIYLRHGRNSRHPHSGLYVYYVLCRRQHLQNLSGGDVLVNCWPLFLSENLASLRFATYKYLHAFLLDHCTRWLPSRCVVVSLRGYLVHKVLVWALHTLTRSNMYGLVSNLFTYIRRECKGTCKWVLRDSMDLHLLFCENHKTRPITWYQQRGYMCY